MSETATLLHVGRAGTSPPSVPEGWTVETVSSAAAASDRLCGGVDCVLVDHETDDGGDGLAVLDVIDAPCPVLYRSAEPDGELASAASARGAVHYLHGGDDVAERLRAVVDTGDATARRAADPGTTTVDRPVVLERIDEAYLSFDTDWNFTYINERGAEILGASPDDLVGENVWEVFPEATDHAYYDEYTDAIETGEPVSFEEYYEPLDLWTSNRAYPTEDGLSVFFHDITERKRYEEMLPGLLQTTRDMMQADGPEEIAEQLVAATEDLLSLDLSVVRFHEVGGDELVPIEGTAALAETVGDRPVYDVGEGGPGAVFESGAATYRDQVDVDGIDAVLYLPLGEHGTLSAGVGDGEELGGVEKQTAELLAANATTALDRTERRERLELFERVIESVEDMLYVLDADGQFVYVSEPFVEFTGYEREELVGATPAVVVDRETLERGRAVVAELRRSDERSRTIQTEIETSDGERRPVEVDVALLPNDTDADPGTVAVVRDVSALQETQQRLAIENDRFRYLFDHIPDALVEFTFDGTEPVVESVNPAFERTFGISAGHAVGESLNDLIVPKQYHDQAKQLDESIVAGAVETKEVERSTSTGVGHFLFRGVSFGTDANRRGFCIYTDISDQKERESRLEVLHTVLRHNLRTEMNLIVGYAEQLQRRYDDDPVLLDAIRREANQVADLSDTARRVERALDRDDDHLAVTDVTRYVAEAAETARKRFPHADLTVSTPESATAVADRRLVFALSNAIENAVDHNDSEHPSVDVSVERTDEEVEIRVADDGPGIPKQERDLVTGERDITQLQHGSGLGLWAINWIVESFGGSLAFETSEKGSVVVLRLRTQ
ncbi:PAS domain S-box protein [Haloarchaeobius baliensis]|uniref:sensor histidine kinase n=1 Tax=Haloarchaeobius baliensis TaxID=1670458 RepID=UPI003F8828E6